MKKNNFFSLNKKLAFSVWAVSTLATLFFSISQGFIDYTKEKNEVLNQLQFIESSFIPSISKTFWELNYSLLTSQLEGIKKLKYISSIQVYDQNRRQIYYSGNNESGNLKKNISIVANKEIIGSLTVEIALNKLKADHIKTISSLFLREALKALLVTGSMFFMFRFLITNRLVSFYDQIKNQSFLPNGSVNLNPIIINSNALKMDEFDRITEEFNRVLFGFKENYEAKINFSKNLEKIITERTSALSIAMRELELSNKELESFSYSVSHDLRAPLRGIDGWSLVLLEDYSDALDDKAKGYLARVRSETQRMGELIDDLLKLSQITRNEMKWEKVNLSEIAEVIKTRLLEESEERVVNFVIQPNMQTEGNGKFLEIVLTNLLENAYKFTSKQKEAEIEVGKTYINELETYFVRDNGVGFNLDNAKNLFGTFERLHKKSEFPGTGVGLATVKRIIAVHNGKVWAESRINQGATFFFTLNKKEFTKHVHV